MKVSFTHHTSHTAESQVLGYGEVEVERCFQVVAEVVGDGDVDAANLLDVYCQETHHYPTGEIVLERAELFIKTTPPRIWQMLETEAIDRASVGLDVTEA